MYRKIEEYLKNYFSSKEEKILVIDGARQVGKTYIIEKIGKEYYRNFISINLDADKKGDRVFEDVKTCDDFYIQLSALYGNKLNNRDDTLVFIDEISIYPQFFSLLKQLRIDNKYRYICSGSLLGIELLKTGLTPMGSIIRKEMYRMDFEEFLIANNFGPDAINYVRRSYENRTSLNESLHNTLLNLFLTYLYVGGLPDAVKSYVEEKNVFKIKEIQKDIYDFYSDDAAKYDLENRLKIKRIYEMMISSIDNKVKRIKYSDINDNKKDCFANYVEEFDYLINSGIALACNAVSEPKFPLAQSSVKNLIKLYMNDVGLLSYLLYRNNINAILKSKTGVNLGAIYETVVSQELKAHGHDLFYYDRRKVGEVDFLVNDYDNLSILPLEIKSGKDGYEYRALPKLIEDKNYRIKQGYVLSNDREVLVKDNIIHLPIYYIMFI